MDDDRGLYQRNVVVARYGYARLGLAYAAVVVVWLCASGASPVMDPPGGAVVAVGERASLETALGDPLGGGAWGRTFRPPDRRPFLLAQVRLEPMSGWIGHPFRMSVSSAWGDRVLAEATWEDEGGAYKTPPLPGSSDLRVEVEGPQGARLWIQVEFGTLQPEMIGLGAVPDWKTVDDPAVSRRHAEVAGAVVRLRTKRGALCSGFLGSTNVVLTASHCLLEDETCDDLEIVQELRPRAARHLKCLEIIQREFAGVMGIRVQGASTRPPPPLKARHQPMPVDSEVWLLHHPAGLPLQVSAPCRQESLREKIEHTCFSLPGSSGAPLMDERGEVVGVHQGSERLASQSDVDLATLLAAGEKVPKNLATPIGPVMAGLADCLRSTTPARSDSTKPPRSGRTQ